MAPAMSFSCPQVCGVASSSDHRPSSGGFAGCSGAPQPRAGGYRGSLPQRVFKSTPCDGSSWGSGRGVSTEQLQEQVVEHRRKHLEAHRGDHGGGLPRFSGLRSLPSESLWERDKQEGGGRGQQQATRCFQKRMTLPAVVSEETATKEDVRLWTGGGGMVGTEQPAMAGFPYTEERRMGEGELMRETRMPVRTEQEILLSQYIPVYVMLPLDTVTPNNILSYPERLMCNLRALKAAGVDGVMADVWWGIVEASGPGQYEWSAYLQLFKMIQSTGLKVQVVMSFHQCGGNTGDSCYIPLPGWVLGVGEENPDIYFTNRDRRRNQEYLSFSIDDRPVLLGRSAVQVYYDFMCSFRDSFQEFFDSGLIHEIEVGLGPAGELRFPSYPETHGWRFPGIGEFQCYDRYMLEELREAANAVGQYEWGYSGPHDAGHYNDWPHGTGFFGNQASFESDYGRFFLSWYSDLLLRHGDRVLEAATHAFEGCKTRLAAKVAGVHWWYNSRNHAAELAAGYYNTRERDGYAPIAKMLKRHDAILNFTCIEMRNSEQWFEARCGPEGLVEQVLNAAWSQGVEVSCENALPRYDMGAFDQIVYNARPDGVRTDGSPVRRITSFTFLRLGLDLLQERNWNEFVRFVRRMHVGMDYHPEPEQYFQPRRFVRATSPIPSAAATEQPPVSSRPFLDLDSLSSPSSTPPRTPQQSPGGSPSSPALGSFGTLASPGVSTPGVDSKPPPSVFDDPFFSRDPPEEIVSPAPSGSTSVQDPATGPPIDGPLLGDLTPGLEVDKWKGDLVVGEDLILPPEEAEALAALPPLLELQAFDSSSAEKQLPEDKQAESDFREEVHEKEEEQVLTSDDVSEVVPVRGGTVKVLVEAGGVAKAEDKGVVAREGRRTAVLVVAAALVGLGAGLGLAGRSSLRPSEGLDRHLQIVAQALSHVVDVDQDGWITEEELQELAFLRQSLSAPYVNAQERVN